MGRSRSSGPPWPITVLHAGEVGGKLKVLWHQEIEWKYAPSVGEAEKDLI